MSREEMYHKPKYGQNDTVWVERAADQPLEGQVFALPGWQNVRDSDKRPGCEGGPGAGTVPTHQRRETLGRIYGDVLYRESHKRRL